MSENQSRDTENWAQPITKIKVSDVPIGAINLNMDGRQVASPLQGFGQLWVRTYRIRLSGAQTDAKQVVADWKHNFGKYQPPANHFYPSLAGVKPGEMVFIDTKLPIAPGMPGIMPVAVGVMVIYADDELFTVMTPQGHPVAGWNNFSAYEEDGATVAQVQAMVRASDPIYEFGYRLMGGEAAEDKTWIRVLELVAERWQVKGAVQVQKSCLDPNVQWSQWKNVWQNAMFRTFFYVLLSPLRWVRNLFQRKSPDPK